MATRTPAKDLVDLIDSLANRSSLDYDLWLGQDAAAQAVLAFGGGDDGDSSE